MPNTLQHNHYPISTMGHHRNNRHHNHHTHTTHRTHQRSSNHRSSHIHDPSSAPKNVYTVATPASAVAARGAGAVITARSANPAVAATFVPDEVAVLDDVSSDPNGNHVKYKADANNNNSSSGYSGSGGSGRSGDYVVRHVSMIRVNEGGGSSSLRREATFTKADDDDPKDVWRVTQVIAPGKEDGKKGQFFFAGHLREINRGESLH